jgi:hypothetical protein
MKRVYFATFVMVLGILALGTSASATPYGFNNITNHATANIAGQLSMDVTEVVGGMASFRFTNNVGTLSSIQQIYFDASTLSWLSFVSMDQNAGVVFGTDGATPADLPAGNPYSFTSSYGYDADQTFGTAHPPQIVSQIENGINHSGEWLSIVFSFNYSHTFDQLIAALDNNTFRVGLHVQSIGGSGGPSDSFINTPVPEPATMLLLGTGLAGLLAANRHRKANKS